MLCLFLSLQAVSPFGAPASPDDPPPDEAYIEAVLSLTETNKSVITGRNKWCGPCGSGAGQAIPDEWFFPTRPNKTAKFYEACKRHDACYATLGRSRSWCDHAFKGRMYEECERAFHTQWDFVTGAWASCRGAANGYYELVVANAGKAYETSQEESRRTHPDWFGYAYAKEALLDVTGAPSQGLFSHVDWARQQPAETVREESRRLLQEIEKELPNAGTEPLRRSYASLKNAWLIRVHHRTEPYDGHFHAAAQVSDDALRTEMRDVFISGMRSGL